MTAKSYRVEQEGYNDGHMYQVSSHAIIHDARRSLEEHRLSNPKVRFRLINIVEDLE